MNGWFAAGAITLAFCSLVSGIRGYMRRYDAWINDTIPEHDDNPAS